MSAEAEPACGARRNLHPAAERIGVFLEAEADGATRMRHGTLRPAEPGQRRLHVDHIEAEAARPDADERGEVVIERMRRPAVAIRARRLGRFRFEGRLEAVAAQLQPEVEMREDLIAAGLGLQRFKKIMPKVDGGLDQSAVGQRGQKLLAGAVGRHRAAQERKNLRMHAEIFMREVVGVEAALLVPEMLVDLLRQRAHPAIGARGQLRFAEPRLQPGGALCGEDDLQVDRRAHAISAIGRHSVVPMGHPVHEIPAGRRADQARFVRVTAERIERDADARHQPADEFRLTAPKGVVVDHANPPKRERRDDLAGLGGIARLGQAGGNA